MNPITHPTEAKTFLPLLAIQQRPHSIGYRMPVRQFATASEATANSHAARLRLRRGPIAIAAPVRAIAVPMVIQQKPLEPLPHVNDTAPLDMLRPCSWRFLVALAALRHGQSYKDIIGPRRSLPVAKARHVAVYLVVLHTPYSIARIANLFNRHHTTLLNSLEKFPPIQRANRPVASPAKAKLDWETING